MRAFIFNEDTDQLSFDKTFDGDHYVLEIKDPSTYFYTLTINGKSSSGSLPYLHQSLNNSPVNNANLWLFRVVNSLVDTSTIEFEKEEFTVGNRNYAVSFHESGLIKLHFPETFIVSQRTNLSNNYSAIYSIMKGQLSMLLTNCIADSGVIPDDNKTIPVSLPVYTDQLSTFEMEGWQVQIDYQLENDLIFLHMDARVIHSHVSGLSSDVWEYHIIDNGKYKQVLDNLLAKHGLFVD